MKKRWTMEDVKRKGLNIAGQPAAAAVPNIPVEKTKPARALGRLPAGRNDDREKAYRTPLQYQTIIGIDTGVNTGFAIWDRGLKTLINVESLMIHQAMAKILSFDDRDKCFVRVEDARLRKWIPKDRGRDQLQGAGSIKRDASIWEAFLKDIGIAYEMVAPKNNKTKTSAEYFKQVTGWPTKTNEHARDAAWLVYGY